MVKIKEFVVSVWGDFACFTRPEMKVERLSYPFMTPSAARGVLDAIYCKPQEFCWRVDRIDVMNSIRFIALRRNEVKDRISERAIMAAIKGGPAPVVVADATRDSSGSDQMGRTQRQTIALRDVEYRIHAHITPRDGFQVRAKALEEQAQRRMLGGKCFYQPYLGCREFPAYFELCAADDTRAPLPHSMDIGLMVYDVFNLDFVETGTASPFISLFRANLNNGTLHIPPWESPAVLKPERGG